jgi:CxxC-x17-CxxC domain-containing protein
LINYLLEDSSNEKMVKYMADGKDSMGRELFKAVCADCKKETEVPFKPDASRPVYCRDCYQNHKKPRRDNY